MIWKKKKCKLLESKDNAIFLLLFCFLLRLKQCFIFLVYTARSLSLTNQGHVGCSCLYTPARGCWWRHVCGCCALPVWCWLPPKLLGICLCLWGLWSLLATSSELLLKHLISILWVWRVLWTLSWHQTQPLYWWCFRIRPAYAVSSCVQLCLEHRIATIEDCVLLVLIVRKYRAMAG